MSTTQDMGRRGGSRTDAALALLAALTGQHDPEKGALIAIVTSVVYQVGGRIEIGQSARDRALSGSIALTGRLLHEGTPEESYVLEIVEAHSQERTPGVDTFGPALKIALPPRRGMETEGVCDFSKGHTFKIGDRVQLTDDYGPDAPRPGSIGTVVDCGPVAPYVRFDDHPGSHYTNRHYSDHRRGTTCCEASSLSLVKEG